MQKSIIVYMLLATVLIIMFCYQIEQRNNETEIKLQEMEIMLKDQIIKSEHNRLKLQSNKETINELQQQQEEYERFQKWMEKWNELGLRIERFEATAYSRECGYPWNDGITATGTMVAEGRTIAVDPRIISLGSDVWVEGWGMMVAEDVGGAIKGKIIDIYMDDMNNVRNWGRRDVIVIYSTVP